MTLDDILGLERMRKEFERLAMLLHIIPGEGGVALNALELLHDEINDPRIRRAVLAVLWEKAELLKTKLALLGVTDFHGRL